METKTIYIVGNATFESFIEAKNYEKYLKEYDSSQMREIRLGLLHNIDVESYLNPKFSDNKMKQIRLDLEKSLMN